MSRVIRKIINVSTAPQPVGPYSQAVLIDRTMYISGQLGMLPESGQLVSGGIEAEAEQMMKNLSELLKGVDSSMNNDFKENFPARAAYEVAALPKGGLVEMEAIAVLGEIVDQ